MRLLSVLVLVGLAGCGDKCVTLCRDVASRLDQCRTDALSWQDLGARGRNDFVEQCRSAWDLERTELSASHLALSLAACKDASDEVDELTCEEVLALYAAED